MNNELLSYSLALGATLCFSSSTLVYAVFARKVSVIWMNCFKAVLAFIGFTLTLMFTTGWNGGQPMTYTCLFISGLLGLNIGDLFLLHAFTKLGAARTLILFGFQPLVLGLASYFLFGQPFELYRLTAVVFLMGCLFTFSYERFRQENRWEFSGLIAALIGVSFDASGILLTRNAYQLTPSLNPIEANFYRVIGALVGFAVFSRFVKIDLITNFKKWDNKSRVLLVLAGLGGTYVSLSMYLTAIKIGHLASIAAIAITGPIFAASLECLIKRQWPSRYLIIAISLFLCGLLILVKAPGT